MEESKKGSLVLPELDDQSMEKLNETARSIFVRMKKEGTVNGSDDDILDSAIVLGIFAVFNPENVPMPEEQIQTVWESYQDWIRRHMFN